MPRSGRLHGQALDKARRLQRCESHLDRVPVHHGQKQRCSHRLIALSVGDYGFEIVDTATGEPYANRAILLNAGDPRRDREHLRAQMIDHVYAGVDPPPVLIACLRHAE